MPEYLAPGVYVEEVPSAVRPIAGVGTSVAGFIGISAAISGAWDHSTKKGMPRRPDGEPYEQAAELEAQPLNSWTEFTQRFGDIQEGNEYLAHAVYGFFNNGGTRCWVTRIDVAAADFDAIDPALEGFAPHDEIAVVAAPLPPGIATAARQAVHDSLVAHCNLLENRVAILDSARDLVDDKITLATDTADGSTGVPSGASATKPTTEPATESTTEPTAEPTTEPATGPAGEQPVEPAEGSAGGPTGEPPSGNAGGGSPDGSDDEVVPEDGIRRPAADPKGYGAFYFPWIMVADPVGGAGARIAVPPSGHVAGVYARSDAERGVHKAPANEVVRGALGVRYPVSKVAQGPLNVAGVNCLRVFDGAVKVYGARSLGDPEWRYISVRRLVNFLRESIAQGTQWVIFEPNAPELWSKLRRNVSAFLNLVWASGALMGTAPEQAFYVRCDETTNPPEVRDLGQVVIEIGVAIVKPAEFVIFRLSQWAGPQR